MKIYAAGHMLTKAGQLQRQLEKEELNNVCDSLQWYMPQDNKIINDKTTAKQEGLAERIVKHDTEALFWSDTVVIEPLPEALGTHVELGQLKGMRDMAELVKTAIMTAESVDDAFMKVGELCNKQLTRKIYPHYEDIRRFAGVTESEDRRSLAINQYVYGVCLDLSDGKGFYEWEEIKGEVRNSSEA